MAADPGLTQSGVSQALKRLRKVFGDDLFLRRPHGMEPTAVTLELEPAITQAVDVLLGVIGGAWPFDPQTADGLVRIAAHDAEQVALVPRLLCLLAQRAPGLRLSVLALSRRAAVDAPVAGPESSTAHPRPRG